MGLLEQVFISLFILLSPFFLLLVVERKKMKDLSKNLFIGKIDFISGLKLFVIVFAALFAESALLSSLGLLDTEKVQQVIARQSPFALLLAVTLAPLGEELLFRGYLQARFASIFPWKRVAPILGVILASAIFAFLHYGYGSVAEIIAAYIFSFIAGLWLLKEKNVLPCIIAHALFNIMSISATLAS